VGYKLFDRGGKMVEHYHEEENEKHLANFAECVRSRQRPNADIRSATCRALCSISATIVARTGHNLEFDPKTERITNDAARMP